VFSRGGGQGGELWTVAPDGSNPHPLGGGIEGDWPAYAPDGDTIAFASPSSGTWQIYATGADGTGTTRLTQDSWQDFAPAWATDGAWIGFQRSTGSVMQVVEMLPDGTGQLVVVDHGVSNEGRPNFVPPIDDIPYRDLRAKTSGYEARDDGRIVWAQDGSYAQVDAARMIHVDTFLVWVDSVVNSSYPIEVSVGHSSDDQSFYAAVWSSSGTCFFLQDFQASSTLYGAAMTGGACSADDAPEYATEPSWP
jgi:WD40-like Beta Propeller Repeat